MRHFNYIAIFSSTLLLACSCSNDNNPGTNPDPGTPTSPVENNPANTTYTPAFSGQTRIGGLQTNTSYEGKVITSALTAPWGIKSLPD